MRDWKRLGALLGAVAVAGAVLAVPAGTALAASPGFASTVSSGGTTSALTGEFTPSGDGDVTAAEFPGQEDEAAADGGGFTGVIVDRSLSHETGNGVSVNVYSGWR